MDSSRDIDNQDKTAEVSAALERLWVRFLPEIRARVEILESAAQSLSRGVLTPSERQAATGAAHKLAGTLGTFNLARGTLVARELEQLYGSSEGPSADTAAQMALDLREMVEGRAAGRPEGSTA